jgi:hypothetical protein
MVAVVGCWVGVVWWCVGQLSRWFGAIESLARWEVGGGEGKRGARGGWIGRLGSSEKKRMCGVEVVWFAVVVVVGRAAAAAKEGQMVVLG